MAEIDFNPLRETAGEPFSDRLEYLGVIHILDVNDFIEKNRFYPSIESIFIFGRGGSYDFDDPIYGNIYISNGTLASLNDFDLDGLSHAYYRAVFERDYPSYNSYERFLRVVRYGPGITDKNGIEYETLPFRQAEGLLKSGEISVSQLEPHLQKYAGSYPKAIVTLIDPEGKRYLVWAKYDQGVISEPGE